MEILFLNLPYKFKISRASRWPEKTKSGTFYYPYWLSYAAGLAEAKGHSVGLIDAVAEGMDYENAIKKILDINPALLVLEITTPTYVEDIRFIKKLKEQGFTGTVAVGGTHATALPQATLKDCPEIDFLMRGEYDLTIIDIFETSDRTRIPGISYIDCGDIISNVDRPVIEDLDSLPFVSRVYKQHLKPEHYFYALAQHPMIQIVSSRGCPCRCNFCSYPQTMGGRKYRTRSAENFVAELEYIVNELPEVKEIFFEDDTFTVDKKRVVEICDLIIQKRLKITWSANSRADVPYDVLVKMKQAGCRLLVVGYESGNAEILKNIKKGITLDQSLEFAQNTKKLGIKVFGCFMIGLTGDTKKTIDDTFKFARKTDADMVFFQQAVPFPGTEFYNQAKSQGMLRTEDYSQWMNKQGQLDCLVNYPDMDYKQIEKIRDNLMLRYYLSIPYFWKTFIRNKEYSEITRIFRAGVQYLAFRMKKLFLSQTPTS